MNRRSNDDRYGKHKAGSHDRQGVVLVFGNFFPEVQDCYFFNNDKRKHQDKNSEKGIDQGCDNVFELDQFIHNDVV